METDIPIWVTGQQVIKKTVNYNTTCGEVVSAVMGKNGDGWSMVERWRDVEKPLDPSTRILKVWDQWAAHKHQVKIMITRDTGKRRRRRSQRTAIEKLLKLISSRGETVKSRLRLLLSADNDKLTVSDPARMFSAVREETGVVYPRAGTSDADGEEPQENIEDVRELVDIFENIFKINKKLEKQEELLVKLHVQLKKHAEKDRTLMAKKLEQMKIQNDCRGRELENNSWSLAEADAYIKEKRRLLNWLSRDVNQSHSVADPSLQFTSKHNETLSDADTNSDTGLGSLHSSTEEGTYIVESAL